MGAIHVHEFMTLDGVVDAPTWTFDYGFRPEMIERAGRQVDGQLRGHPARPQDVRDVRAGLVDADGRGRPRARRSSTTRPSTSSPGTLDGRDLAELGGHRRVRPRRDPQASRTRSRRPLRQRQHHARARDARRRPRRRPAPVRLSAHPRRRPAAASPPDAAPGDLELSKSQAFDHGVMYLAYRPKN